MATIKISDLSVGDWVKMEDENYQIYHLTLEGDVYGYRKVNITSSKECFVGCIADVCPVSLTPEILEKNGLFRHDRDADNPKRIVLSNHFIMARTYADVDWCRVQIYDEELASEELFNGIIYSVHQLQHALRLAGVDKEINL